MKLKHRFSLIVFTSGLIAVIFSYLFYFYSHKSEIINKTEQDLLLISEDYSSHLLSEISECINIASAEAVSDSVIEVAEKLNKKNSSFSETELIKTKKRIEKEWNTPLSRELLLSEITGNAASEYFLRIKNTFKGSIGEIFLTDRYGITAASTGELTTLTHSEKYWWIETFNSGRGQVFIDDRGFDESVSGYVLGITVPVMLNGEIAGILKNNFNLASVLENIVDSGGNVIIARSGGLVVMDKNKTPLSYNIDKELNPYLKKSKRSGEIFFDNDTFIAASCRVNFSHADRGPLFGGEKKSEDHKYGNNSEGWNIIVLKKKSEVLSPLYHISKSIAQISLLLIIILALVAYAAGVWTSKPVEVLSAALSRIGEGDFSAGSSFKSDDEFGFIAEKIDQMTEKLSKTTASKKELEAEIKKRKEEEKKYSNLFSTMSEGFAVHEIITDDRGKPVDYRYLSINPAFERYTGLKASEAAGKTVKEMLPLLEDQWINTYGRVALTGEPVTFENYSKDLEKYFKCSAFSPEKGLFAVVFSDITDQKNMEKKIEKEKEKLSVTLRSIGDGVITTDSEGNIVLLNTVAEKLTGWTTVEASGKPLNTVFNIINEFTRLPCENPAEKVLSSGEIIELANHTSLISREGIEYIIEDSAAPIRDIKGKTEGVVLVFRDATEKKKTDIALMRSQKLESLSTLAGGIAHDFNNLLSGIFGYIEIAKSGLEMKNYSLAENSLAKIDEVYEKTKKLTHQLLTFSKGGSPKREISDIGKIIRETAEFALTGSKHEADIIIDDLLWMCDCDKNQVSQCIENLIINSKQAMPSGGLIKVTAKNTSVPPSFFEAGSKEGNFVCITVSDTGTGIAPEKINRIFDPFFSTKGSGHGMGLTACYSIIRHHDGWITADSKPDSGTVIKLYLPASNGEEKVTISKKETVKKGKILIMDDEDFIIDILTEMLEMMGHISVSANGGDEALEIIRSSYEKGEIFDVCILDLTIPGGRGGLDIINEIRNISKEPAVIASSGYSDDPVIADPEKYGFSSSLQKPFRIDDLSEIISRYV